MLPAEEHKELPNSIFSSTPLIALTEKNGIQFTLTGLGIINGNTVIVSDVVDNMHYQDCGPYMKHERRVANKWA